MVIVTFVPLQMSKAVGGLKLHGCPHSAVLSGAQVMLGGVVSTTVMVWLHVAELPHLSIAVQTRVAENVLPQSPLVTVLTVTMIRFVPSQVSTAVGGVKLHGVPHSTNRLGAQEMAGGALSTSMMVWLQVALLPHWSVARQVRVAEMVRPHREFVTVLTTTTVTFVPSQRSEAVTEAKLHGNPHSRIRSEPQLRTGGLVSTTRTV
jgi:hypothetical protein